jgi:hypothetical protein
LECQALVYSSSVSADFRSFARSDALQWTSYVGECLSILEREQESPLDAILVQRVKVNRVVEKANLALVRYIESFISENIRN